MLSNANNIYVTGNSQGVGTGYDIATIKYSPVTKTSQINNNIPDEYKLFQNFPNPFNSSTLIKYNIPKKSFVSLRIYDILGNNILTLINKKLEPGKYEIKFEVENLASGIYFYSLNLDGSVFDTKKLILIK